MRFLQAADILLQSDSVSVNQTKRAIYLPAVLQGIMARHRVSSGRVTNLVKKVSTKHGTARAKWQESLGAFTEVVAHSPLYDSERVRCTKESTKEKKSKSLKKGWGQLLCSACCAFCKSTPSKLAVSC